MKKKYNYNYAIVFYDIGEKRVQKVFKICKNIYTFSYSVLEVYTPSNLIL